MAEAVIDVPLAATEEEIQIDLTEQDPDVVVGVMKNEKARLELWHKLALYYYRNGQRAQFVSVLETVSAEDVIDTMTVDEKRGKLMKIRILTTLAAHYLSQAEQASDDSKSRELSEKAERLHNRADNLAVSDQSNLAGKGRLYLIRGDYKKSEQFLSALAKGAAGEKNIAALLLKASADFNQSRYREALEKYRRVLRLKPDCPADVRVGVAMCWTRLGEKDKACEAFDRALALDPENIDAIVGRAVLELNSASGDSAKLKRGMDLVIRAYGKDKTNATVLNHLADHFFLRTPNDGRKVINLATHALRNTDVSTVQAESHFHIGRVHHRGGDYEQAFKHFYQASKLSPKFSLAHYHLGQMYVHKRDRTTAIECFEKVLRHSPNSYETLKILGHLYGQSEHPKNRQKGAAYLKRVTQIKPADLEAWMELASLLEGTHPVEAIKVYQEAEKLLEGIPEEVMSRVELYNNLGTLYMKTSQYKEAEGVLEQALTACCVAASRGVEDSDYYASIEVSIRYNLGLVLESMRKTKFEPRIYRVTNNSSDFEKGDLVSVIGDSTGDTCTVVKRDGVDGLGAINEDGVRKTTNPILISTSNLSSVQESASSIYNSVVSDIPRYVDCHLRLCQMNKESRMYSAAMDHIKRALEDTGRHADIWTAWGNVHRSKREVQKAQKKFEQILEEAKVKDDPYALIALGNIWLAEAHSSRSRANPEAQKRAIKYARLNFRSVLKKEPRNIYAANGLGCILALQERFVEAKDVFVSVREAESEIPEPWLNLATVYLAQKNYINAIKLFENCLRRFFNNQNVDIMQCLAEAEFKAERFEECRLTLIRAMHIAPDEMGIRYNFATATLSLADSILRQASYSLVEVERADELLRSARASFKYLEMVKSGKFTREQVVEQTKRCEDYSKQAARNIESARQREQQKAAERKRMEAQRRQHEERVLSEKAAEEAKRVEEQQEKLAKIAKLQETIEKEDLLNIQVQPKERRSDGPRKRSKKGAGALVPDDEDSAVPVALDPAADSAGESVDEIVQQAAPRKEKRKRASARDNGKYKSTETISDDSDEAEAPELEEVSSSKKKKLDRHDSSESESDDEAIASMISTK